MEIRELRELSEDYIAEMLTKLGLGTREALESFVERSITYIAWVEQRGVHKLR